MNDEELKQLFAQTEQTEASESAKRRALNAAMSEFKATKKTSWFQGILDWIRPTVEQSTKARSQTMNTSTLQTHSLSFSDRKWQIAGLSTASVLFLAILVANHNPDLSSPAPELLTDAEPNMQSAPARQAESSRAHDESLLMERLEQDIAVAESKAVATLQAPATPAPSRRLMESEVYGLVAPNFAPTLATSDIQVQPGYRDEGRDRFQSFEENPVKSAATDPVSTFSIDVDTASYSFVRRQLNTGVLPQKDAVRIEEMINYFDYAYPLPTESGMPFSTQVKVMDSPWKPGNKLIHIGIQGYELPASETRQTNLVFLLDVSGSMNSPDKLPLVKQSMELLLSQLNPDDTIAIAVYAGAAGTVLEPTPVREKVKIYEALQRLQAGGSTAGGAGLKLAYQLAETHYREDATNRIILATDGDFNVGITNQEELKGFVERKRDEGIYLSVLGFGQGNYQDAMMQALAQNGNGVAAYIDTLGEAQKVLVNEATSALFPIANDVKIQVEFNPDTVSEYRLIGYETRQLANEDFNNDKVDAGDIGAGHSVTAIYEITPTGAATGLLPERRYADQKSTAESETLSEYGFLSLRYKLPDEKHSQLITQPILIDTEINETEILGREAQFAAAVAGFAQILKGGQYTGDWSYDDAINLAQANKGEDFYGYRTEFIQLIRKAKIAAEL